jgi:hypothetical protein
MTEDATPADFNEEDQINDQVEILDDNTTEEVDEQEAAIEAILAVRREAEGADGETADSSDADEDDDTEALNGDAVEEDDTSEADDEEDTRFDKNPRFQQLIRERNELREAASKGQLTDEDRELLAAIKSYRDNPDGAIKALNPILEDLGALSGSGPLPDDLAEAVEMGEISEQYARDLVKAQAHQKAATARQEQYEQEQVRRAQETHLTEVRSRYTEIEAKFRKSDPDYDKKQELVQSLALRMAPGGVKSADQLVEIMTAAKKKVDEAYGVAKPKPKPVRPVSGQAPTRTQRKPQSYDDIINDRLSQPRAK